MRCPNCGGLAESECVDVGVGLIIRGDYTCACGWEHGGPDDYGFVDLDRECFPLELIRSDECRCEPRDLIDDLLYALELENPLAWPNLIASTKSYLASTQ